MQQLKPKWQSILIIMCNTFYVTIIISVSILTLNKGDQQSLLLDILIWLQKWQSSQSILFLISMYGICTYLGLFWYVGYCGGILLNHINIVEHFIILHSPCNWPTPFLLLSLSLSHTHTLSLLLFYRSFHFLLVFFSSFLNSP